MNIIPMELLHKRILDNCSPLFKTKDFGSISHKAMTQVEIALKEKGGIVNQDLFGKRLIDHLLKDDKKIKMKVPLGDELQKEALTLFKGAFGYYRNYAAHDGSKIDEKICARILIIASELLDLIDVSSLSVECDLLPGNRTIMDVLIKNKTFQDREDIKKLLLFLHNQSLPYEVADGFFEGLFNTGYNEEQLDSLLVNNLIEYKRELANYDVDGKDVDYIGWFVITPEGASLIDMTMDEIEKLQEPSI